MAIDDRKGDPLARFRTLTMKEVCELTHYTPQHIYRLIKAKTFPAPIKLGLNRIGFRVADIDAWFTARETYTPRTNDSELGL
jgi:excisionase family DNA binding protein